MGFNIKIISWILLVFKHQSHLTAQDLSHIVKKYFWLKRLIFEILGQNKIHWNLIYLNIEQKSLKCLKTIMMVVRKLNIWNEKWNIVILELGHIPSNIHDVNWLGCTRFIVSIPQNI